MASREVLKLITRARKGETAARLDLGRLYLVGTKGLAPNPSAAFNWLVEAWKDGAREAANDIARLPPPEVFPDGTRQAYLEACASVATDTPRAAFSLAETHARDGELNKARTLYQSAASAGHARAALRLGRMLAEESGTASAEATRWLRIAAENGEVEAIAPLADLLATSGNDDARPWLRKLADAGDAAAMVRLARCLLESSELDGISEARNLLAKAAKLGEPQALWLFGRMHIRQFRDERHADFGPHSPRKALELLERAAQAGVAEAHWDLARLYAQPQSATADQRAARRHLEAAAEAGIAGAQLRLARRLIQRRDDPESWLRAGHLLTAAREDEKFRELADAMLSEIADRPRTWAPEDLAAQHANLPRIAAEFPRLAARLGLASSFGLTTREALFIDLQGVNQGWCLFADLREHFQYRPWRMIRAETEEQRAALDLASQAAQPTFPGEREVRSGATRARARRLASQLQKTLHIDPAIFINDWQPPG